ncbi:MBL fold metallo-hydrolase [bacterium]|nr:MBL fold metallo-hydrolase [bacterium]
MKISDHVYFYRGSQGRFKSSASNTYLICGDRYCILIDPGAKAGKHLQRTLRNIVKDGVDLGRIREIWLTHAHPDHAEGINYVLERIKKTLKKSVEIKICCHPRAKSILESKDPMAAMLSRELKIAGYWYREIVPVFEFHLAIWLSDLIFGRWKKARINHCFQNKEIIDLGISVRVIYLPGHTPESTAFWVEKERLLIIGDLIDPRKKQPIFVFNTPSSDLDAAIRSVKKIIKIEPEILAFGHGPIIRGKEKIRKLLEKYLTHASDYKEKARKYIIKNPDFTLLELGKAIEPEGLSHTATSTLGFVVLKALKKKI